MATELMGYLARQFDTAWKLTAYHLDGLQTNECLWRPASRGLHVEQSADGDWHGQWPDRESYDLGPASIAWLTWHIGFWWSMVADHSFGNGVLKREDVRWPGSAQGALTWLNRLQLEWRAHLDSLTDEDLRSELRTHWPFQKRPFGDIVAWVNIELTKNAAEIGYARFLYAARAVA